MKQFYVNVVWSVICAASGMGAACKRQRFYFVLIIFYFVFGPSIYGGPALPLINWKELPDLPSASGGHLILHIDGELRVIGGTYWQNDTKYWHNRILRLNPDETGWSECSKLPVPLGYAAGCYHEDKIILSGGNTTGGKANLQTYVLKNDDITWGLSAILKSQLLYAAVANDSNSMFALGGLLQKDKWDSVTNRLLIMDLKHPEQGWKEGKPLPGEARALSAMCAHHGKLYLFGGANRNIVNLSECWTLDLQTNNWTRLPDMPAATRYSLALPWEKWIIIIANCMTDQDNQAITTNRIFFFNTETKQWYSGGVTPYTAVADGIIHENRIYLIGGEDKGKSRVSTCRSGVINK